MKNKKILARIIALTSALVLVVALALPCFADEPPSNAQLWAAFVENDPEIVDNFAVENLASNGFFDVPIDLCATIHSFQLNVEQFDTFYNYPLFGNYISANSQTPIYFENILYRGAVTFTPSSGDFPLEVWYFDKMIMDVRPLAYVYIYFDDMETNSRALAFEYTYNAGNYDLALLSFNDDEFEFSLGTLTDDRVDVAVLTPIYNATAYDDIFRCITDDTYGVSYPSGFALGYNSNTNGSDTPVTPDEPTRSGMFGELYEILGDAIYGDGATIDGTQDLALTLVATLLVFCVILLPVLLVVAMMFKLFRW